MKITNEMKEEITLRLANDPDSRVRADAYSSPLMPKEKLSEMARNPKADKEEKIAVASNPNTPPDDLDRLADDSTTWGVKEAVAKNGLDELKKYIEKIDIVDGQNILVPENFKMTYYEALQKKASEVEKIFVKKFIGVK